MPGPSKNSGSPRAARDPADHEVGLSHLGFQLVPLLSVIAGMVDLIGRAQSWCSCY